ncbi:hypothetical protein FRC11_007228 [Ceratobasidium sp. 423]|nr:hypothetical protein FRC11_007228 [Ceratobasidium sp. 423]
MEYFQEVNGRMFPIDRNVPFILPTDHGECQRLELHMALKLLLRANYFGPVLETLAEDSNRSRKRVLDLFTADGTWVREMAAEFPHVDFTSVDTVPLARHIRFANILSYEVYDLYNVDETFDVVHLRYAMLRVKDLSALVPEVHHVLRPVVSFSTANLRMRGTMAPLKAMMPPVLHRIWFVPCASPERNCTVKRRRRTERLHEYNSGSEDVSRRPMACYATLREVGLITQSGCCDMWKNLRSMFPSYGMSEVEADELIDGTVAEIKTPGPRQLYIKYHVLYAFKLN